MWPGGGPAQLDVFTWHLLYRIKTLLWLPRLSSALIVSTRVAISKMVLSFWFGVGNQFKFSCFAQVQFSYFLIKMRIHFIHKIQAESPCSMFCVCLESFGVQNQQLKKWHIENKVNSETSGWTSVVFHFRGCIINPDLLKNKLKGCLH